MIDFRRLRYFLAVASARSFTKAAESLNMAQPPLSKRIQELEAEIGASLFNRDARPLELTPAGRLLYEQAMQVTQRMDQMDDTIRRFVAAEKRRLVIGLVPSGFHAHLSHMIRHYRKIAPDVELSLSEMTSIEQIVALKDGRIDVALGRVRIEDAALVREVLREEPMLIALPVDHPLADEPGAVDLRVFEQTCLITFPRNESPSYADHIRSLCHDHGVVPGDVLEVGEVQTAQILVAAGMGACLLPDSVRHMAHPEIILRPLKQSLTLPVILYHRAGDTSYELQMLFRTCSDLYEEWGQTVPEGIRHKLTRSAEAIIAKPA